ncbi:alpha/beta hydrolase [Aestuariibacter salexigens]|uniref:alpha/beta hydrolase n=1 Tax=Aestuariibacter salexigens TaxID=226010 RepID=UPI001F0A1946|nr:alpha/beta hydrolase-fold protein [Aestuariibacter salexigens]
MNIRSLSALLLLCVLLSPLSSAQQKPSGTVLINEPVVMPGLERERIIRVYLPPGYADSEELYPVLYMHDGQNLFDAKTAYAGEWQIDETLDKLAAEQSLKLIVVGIDNGQEKRMNELSPWTNPRFGEAEGMQYMRFIVDTVKPMIDRQYRTLAARQHTAIMGSSMGGLMSHFALFAFPETFSKAGVFSPSYWYADAVFDFTAARTLAKDARLAMLVGTEEGEGMVEGLTRMRDQLRKAGISEQQFTSKIVQGAEHNEAFWRDEFGAAVSWLFNNNNENGQ